MNTEKFDDEVNAATRRSLLGELATCMGSMALVKSQAEGTETNSSAESIPFSDIEKLISAVSFGEQRLVVLSMLAMSPSLMSQRDMAKKMKELQEPNPGWLMSPLVAVSYCDNVFERVGAVVKKSIDSKWKGRMVDAFEVTEFGRIVGLGVAGHLMQWSLEHDELSLGEVFGTKYDSDNADGVSSQWARFGIVSNLLTAADDEDIGLVGVQGYKCLPELRKSPIVNEMQRSGLLEIKRANDLSGRLIDTGSLRERRMGAKPVEGTSDENQAYHHVLKELRAEGTMLISAQELFERIIKEWPVLDPKSVRHNIVVRLGTHVSTEDHFVVRGPGNFQEDGHHTIVTLKPALRSSLEELCNIILRCEDPGFVDEGIVLAQSIMADPVKVSKLMLKARKKSGFADAMPKEQLHDNIMARLKGYEGITVDELVGVIFDITNKKYSRAAASKVLNDLVASGRAVRGLRILPEGGRPLKTISLPTEVSDMVDSGRET